MMKDHHLGVIAKALTGLKSGKEKKLQQMAQK